MKFITKQVKTQSLGEYLGTTRRRMNLSLEEVARFSQVQPKYLLALEEGRFGDLPSEVYVKGFLRSLGQIFRLDENKLIARFEEEKKLEKNLMPDEPHQDRREPRMPRLVLSPRVLTLLSVGLLAALGLGYLYLQVRSLSRAPKLEISSPASGSVVYSALLEVRGKTEPGSQVFINGQPIVVDASGAFRENLSLSPGTNQLVIRAVNKFGKETTVNRSIVLAEKSIAGSSTDEDIKPLPPD